MTNEERLLAAMEYQQAMRAALGNQNLLRQGRRMNLPARQAPGALSEFVTKGMSLDPQPDQGYGTMAADMALSFIPGVGQAMAARDLERARRDSDPLGMALAGTSFVPFGKLIGALRGGKQIGPVSQLDVYHGSPYKFDQFDASKIGTGEGAQAYGHGLYFAEAKDVGGSYAKNLANRDMANQGRLNAHANAQRLAAVAGDAKYAADDIRFVLGNDPNHDQKQLLTDTLGFLESGAYAKPLANPGSLYKVDLPDEQIAKMLDWDKPLREQPEILKVLKGEYRADYLSMFKDKPGSDFYKAISGNAGVEDLRASGSSELQKLGIPGIRYLDGGSRAGGKGTSNFVVFPGSESMLTILERNNQDVRNIMKPTVPESSLMYKDPFGEID